jgi:hypothetical protein
METTIETSIDSVRLREGQIEIEPSPREVRIVARGTLHVASPATESVPLSKAEVEGVCQALRERQASPAAAQMTR